MAGIFDPVIVDEWGGPSQQARGRVPSFFRDPGFNPRPGAPPFFDTTDVGFTPRPSALPEYTSPQTPVVTTPSATDGNPPSTSTEANLGSPVLNIPPSAADKPVELDPLRGKQTMLDAAVKAGPRPRPLTGWEKLAGIISAGAIGWGDARRGPNAAGGIQAAESIFARPKEEAEKRYNQQVTGLEREVDTEEKRRAQDIQATKEADEASFRRRQEEHMKWLESGGAETARLTAEQKFRHTQADSLKKAGYTDAEVAEYEANGKIRDDVPKSDMEALVMAHEIGPDGKPTPRAQQAAAAHKQYVDDRLKEIRASKDPNETTKLVGSYLTDIMAQRGQIAREMENIQKDPIQSMDPTGKARVGSLQKTLSDLDDEISAAREFIKGKVPGLGAKPQAGGAAPAAGKPVWDAKQGKWVQGTAPAPTTAPPR